MTEAMGERRMRRNAAANRERILIAAEAVFGARGAVGSTEDVAERAGVGIATVFRHFPTKEALIEAALLRHFATLDAQAAELAAQADPAEALRQLLTRMIDTGATKLALASLVGGRDEPPPSVLTAAEQLRATMRVIVERAQAAGAVRDDVGVDEIYVLVRGLAQASATLPSSAAALSGALDVVLRGLAPSRC